MGDEPYAALLPWAVFAVVDRAHGGGPVWAALGALITAVTLLMTSTQVTRAPRNVLVVGAVLWFGALTVAGAVYRSEGGFLTHDGRALAAAGFALIVFASLLFEPVSAYYTRPHVRPSRWDDPAYKRVNVLITLLWGATASGIVVSHIVAASMSTPEASTVFNWVVPLALVALAAHRYRICWNDFNDDEEFDPDPMRELALDWEDPLHPTDR